MSGQRVCLSRQLLKRLDGFKRVSQGVGDGGSSGIEKEISEKRSTRS